MYRYTPWFNKGLFGSVLVEQLDNNDPLLVLGRSINWSELCLKFTKFYDNTKGRPSIDLRLLISIYMLKIIYNLTDEGVITAWKQNVFYQAFSGAVFFCPCQPFSPETLCNFRKRVGQEGFELIFAETVKIHGLHCLEKEAIIDSTAQIKAITYPTDTKLRMAVIRQCWSIGKHLEINFDSDFHEEVKGLLKSINFTKITKNKLKNEKKEKDISRLKDIANILIDQLESKAHPMTKEDKIFIECMSNYRKAVNQQKNDKNKIYSIYEPHVACICKGKLHQKWEYGNKVSFAIGVKHKIILGVSSFVGAPFDGDTISGTLEMMGRCFDGYQPDLVIGDLGYRGRPEVLGTKVVTPQDIRKMPVSCEREALLAKLTSRSAIEPIIGHAKSDYGMARNLLSGVRGDQINAISAAAGFNLKKFLNNCEAKTIVTAVSRNRKAKSKTRQVPFVKPRIPKSSILPIAA
jgi:IS5 family transposase